VSAAIANVRITIALVVACSRPLQRSIQEIRRRTSGLPTRMAKAITANVAARGLSTVATETVPDKAMLETTESNTHPTVSSAIEAARMIAPTSRRVSLRSSSVFAITFTAEIDIAVARKSASTVRSLPRTSRREGSQLPSANPEKKGRRIPSTLV